MGGVSQLCAQPSTHKDPRTQQKTENGEKGEKGAEGTKRGTVDAFTSVFPNGAFASFAVPRGRHKKQPHGSFVYGNGPCFSLDVGQRRHRRDRGQRGERIPTIPVGMGLIVCALVLFIFCSLFLSTVVVIVQNSICLDRRESFSFVSCSVFLRERHETPLSSRSPILVALLDATQDVSVSLFVFVCRKHGDSLVSLLSSARVLTTGERGGFLASERVHV
mmetsp:Transcript_18551/g.46691  ORF Transcript_18551/g.46691 Transcript_18551/m.46691 type:complete len:219 (-) Transcript_18551:1739-2395(-)